MSEIATEKITPAQRRAIESLLTSGNVAQAAQAAGVNRSTLYKWQALPSFKEAMQEAEREAVESLSRALAGLGDAAAQTLRDAMTPTQKITVRLRAAEVVCTNLLRLRELVNIEARIKALEESNKDE